jgi:saccharopine dehydrogenase-like NADP-dependent oxidoreductase
MTKVAIFGAGQIGRAVYQIIIDLSAVSRPFENVDAFVIDSSEDNIRKLKFGSHYTVDMGLETHEDIVKLLKDQGTTHVINAMPFSLNEKVASAAAAANCNYIDFTEDDVMADKVQKIFEGTGLTCAVKCGLAPGFINYIGYNLVGLMDTPDSLMISVGALPRTVSYDMAHPENSYNLTWSVDGLVNEYIRPCRVRKDGKVTEIPALGGLVKVVIDGFEYEAAYTSGGVGSLARDLTNVPNVCYMTLRYPGHYRYIREVVQGTHGNFEKLRKLFLEKFPFTDDDVIVVYATITGKDATGALQRRAYSNKFYGVDGLTGIQSTTAGSGVAMLELMLTGKVQGIVDHPAVSLAEFTATQAFNKYYKTSK